MKKFDLNMNKRITLGDFVAYKLREKLSRYYDPMIFATVTLRQQVEVSVFVVFPFDFVNADNPIAASPKPLLTRSFRYRDFVTKMDDVVIEELHAFMLLMKSQWDLPRPLVTSSAGRFVPGLWAQQVTKNYMANSMLGQLNTMNSLLGNMFGEKDEP
jgi:hypothetical protein